MTANDSTIVRAIGATWARAVDRADLSTLADLMAADIIVVHGSGRCVRGRDTVLADLASTFKDVHVKQDLQPEETIVAGSWAFDRSRVQTTMVWTRSGKTQRFASHAWTILRKDAVRGWCVARVIGVVDQTACGT